MTAAIVVLTVLLILFLAAAVNYEREGDRDGANSFRSLSVGCLIAIGVLAAILAWRYLP